MKFYRFTSIYNDFNINVRDDLYSKKPLVGDRLLLRNFGPCGIRW
jgi:hypothetical protein